MRNGNPLPALALGLAASSLVAVLFLTSASIARVGKATQEVEPVVEARSGPARAGKLFTGIDIWIPLAPSFRVLKVTCPAFLEQVPIRPIIRGYYLRLASGRRPLRRITCGWRLPKSSRGKLLSLTDPNCSGEDCGGVSIDWEYEGRGRGSSLAGSTWRVRR